MSAYVIVESTVIDRAQLGAYAAAAGPIIARFGGEMLARGGLRPLRGEAGHDSGVIIRFPDAAAAEAWFASADYQALTATRDAAMHSTFRLLA